MLKRDPEDMALDRILGDMDDREGQSMMGGKPQSMGEGMDIVISLRPIESEEKEKIEEDKFGLPEGHEEMSTDELSNISMGGTVKENELGKDNLPADHKLHRGGIVAPWDGEEVKGGSQGNRIQADPEEKGMPPFLRKKKK